MAPNDQEAPSEGALADRLARLAERRRASARRHSSRSVSSGDEAEARMPPRHGAVQALRELLEGRAMALEQSVPADSEVHAPPLASPHATTRAALQQLLPAGEHRAPQSEVPTTARTAASSSGSGGSSAGSSVPPTARMLISLGTGIGRETAAGERQQRHAELRDADAAVREAEVQRAELDALLLRQRAAEVQRERQRAERQAQLERIQFELARQHLAAWRIGCAWRRFLSSPGRLCEVAAATRIQAVWRGWASRRRTAVEMRRFRQQRALLAQLQAAVAAGELAQAQDTLQNLAGLGGSRNAEQQVAGLQRRAAEAEHAVRAAAAKGGAQAFAAALAGAQRYSHLAGARLETQNQFAARVAAAEEAVEGAVESGPLLQFKEAVAAAAALGVDAALLERAEQRVSQRNQQASAELQAALESPAFSSTLFASCLERAHRCGLHADAARAQRGLQLRRHRAAGTLQQLAAAASAQELEDACRDAVQLGMEAEVEAALAKLEQRQARAAEELRQAANCGSLQRYKAAAATADMLQISPAVRQTCREQMEQRQQEAEQQLRMAAAGKADLAAVRRRCQAAALLGLTSAVAAAEQQVQRRREQAIEQLARGTREACRFVESAAQAAQTQGDAAAASLCSSPPGTPWQQVLASWLDSLRELAGTAAERGVAAAVLHPPVTCNAWPAELAGWLVDAQRAAGMELESAVLAAVKTLEAEMQALHVASQVAVVPLKAVEAMHGTAGSNGTSSGRASAGGNLRTSRLGRMAAHPGQNAPPAPLPTARSAGPQQLLVRFREWRQQQEHLLPLVAGAAEHAAAAAEVEAEEGGERGNAEGDVVVAGSSLDLSCQGLTQLEMLEGGSPVATLNLSTNALTSLDALSCLRGLRELHVSGNRLASLEGVQALGRLTLLDASGNCLQSLPSLAGLSSLRHLDVSANQLTDKDLAGAGLGAAALLQLTNLRLGRNRQLGELARWLGPLPSLMRLDISGCGLASLEGLEAAAPLLQVLAASDNALTCLPPSMGLPFLRELWLGGNQLVEIHAWPWLPSLRELHLQDNQLARLAVMQGFPSLRALDLSFNQLPNLTAALASLAPLSATLDQLCLNDNPMAASWGQQQQQQHGAAGLAADQAAAGDAYAAAVFHVLPRLCELDGQPVEAVERQQHLQRAGRKRLPLHGRNAVTASRCADSHSEWEAATVLWAVTQPAAAEAVEQADEQQRLMAVSRLRHHAEGHADDESRGLPAGARDALAATLANLQLAAAANTEAGQAGAAAAGITGSAAARRSTGSSSQLRRGGCAGQGAIRRAQQQYLLLTAAPLSASQGVLLLNSSHYQRLLTELGAAATAIQAAWRGSCARRLRVRLAADWQEHREAAAACLIQAAWHGWQCRHRRCTWVQHRLAAWRQQWREAQQQVAEHQRHCAALRIQTVWRGARVRGLLARARQALLHQKQQQRRHQPKTSPVHVPYGTTRRASSSDGGGERSSLDLELSGGSLDSLLEGASSELFACPEVLRPELAVAAAGGMMSPAVLHASCSRAAQPGGSPLASWPQYAAAGAAGARACAAGGAGAAGGALAARSSRPSTLLPAAGGGAALQMNALLAQLAEWTPADDGTIRPNGSSGTGTGTGSPRQLSGAAAAAAGGVVPSGAGAGWEFSDPATAAAYAQLRQRQQVAARRRELQQQLKDPLQRLQHFQGNPAAPHSRSPGSSLCVPAPHVARGLRDGSRSGSSSSSTTSSGSTRRGSRGSADGGLPALPCLRLPQGRQEGSRPRSAVRGSPRCGKPCSAGARHTGSVIPAAGGSPSPHHSLVVRGGSRGMQGPSRSPHLQQLLDGL